MEKNLEKKFNNQFESGTITDQQTDSSINVDVFNALSLYNEELGEQYQKEGYNPFEKEFKLTKDIVEEILETKKDPRPVKSANFLENGNKKITSYFKNAQNNTEIMINKLQSLLDTQDYSMETFKQLQNNLLFLKNRRQLLKANISKLKNKNANALKMYISLFELDKELSELLDDSYQNQFDINNAIQLMISISIKRANKIKAKKIAYEKQKQNERDINLFDNIIGNNGASNDNPFDLVDDIINNFQNDISDIMEPNNEEFENDITDNIEPNNEEFEDTQSLDQEPSKNNNSHSNDGPELTQ